MYSFCSVIFQKREKLKIKSSAPPNITSDWIGPPDSVSNLRPIKFYIPSDETELQKCYRLQREKVQQWNQQFWLKHNIKFVEVFYLHYVTAHKIRMQVHG